MNLLARLLKKLSKHDSQPDNVIPLLTESAVIAIARRTMQCNDQMPLAARFENGQWRVQTMTIGLTRTAVIDDVSGKVLSVERKGSR